MSFKSGSKSQETFESWESLFRKTLSKDGLLNFIKTADNPIHWIHLLDPFDHQASAKMSGESGTTSFMDLSGLPLIPFSKVQMLKCEKCCLEFCSPVNHRRHLRVIHRRGSNSEKEDARSRRQQLATFWDSLSAEEAGEIVDVKNLVLEDFTGEKVAKALSHLLQQPALLALPHAYVKSGATLLELVQHSSAKQLSSSELFKIFDGSSEKTFPSFGLNVLYRYIFEGGAAKVGLEAKNLVSSLGLLVELNLVKAFIKDKDEEAQRCQTALVEEEEAFHKKQAQLQERKRLKKARQKDVKGKEQKVPNSAKAFSFVVSESSGDEESSVTNSGAGYDVESKSSPNTLKNLYDTLAGEEGDSDGHSRMHVTVHQGFEVNGQPLEPEDSDDSQHIDAVSAVMADSWHENPPSVSARCLVSVTKAGSKHETYDSKHEMIDCAANDPQNESVMKGVTSSGKAFFKERSKYRPMQISKGQALHAPFEKFSWKEKDCVGRKCSGQTVAHGAKEATSLAGPDARSEDFCGNPAVSYQNRQFAGKFVRSGKYPMATSPRTAVWTKKASKGAETMGDDIPDHNSHEDHAIVEVLKAKDEAGAKDCLQVSVAASIESPLSSPGSCGCTQQSPGCSLERCFSGVLASDSGCGSWQVGEGCPLPTLSPGEVGSLVIGSVCFSLAECMTDEDQREFSLNSQGEAPRTKISEASDVESAGSAHSLQCVEDSLRALNENEAVTLTPHKELEWTGKVTKFPWQVDLEEKENHEHPVQLPGQMKSARPLPGQVGFRGGRVKVWRPVVSILPHELKDRVDVTAPANLNAMVNHSNQNSMADLDQPHNNQSVVLEDFKQGQSVPENDSSFSHLNSTNERSESCLVEGPRLTASAFEAVRGFLSDRWSAVVNASDTVVLTLEDEEDLESQSTGLCKNTSGLGDLMNLPPPTNKEALRFPRNERSLHGVWKEGCSGSAMIANRPFIGKSFHAAPRVANYKYVPK